MPAPPDESEWEEYDDAYESDTGGLVHPLPKDRGDKAVGDVGTESVLDEVESAGSVHHQMQRLVSHPPDNKLNKSDYGARVTSILSEATASDCGSSEHCDERFERPSGPKYGDDVIRLHARRAVPTSGLNDSTTPPPAPVVTEMADLAAEASVEAQKRVTEYRRRLARKEEEQRIQTARDEQHAKQVRMMNKEFNRSIGVADIPSEVRFKDALCAKRRLKHQKEHEAAEETANRWYKKITRQTRSEYNAADFCAKILDDARRDHHAKLRAKERHRQSINKKLKQLSLKAKSIIETSGGAYEPGSYILKVASQAAAKPKRRVEHTDSECTQSVARDVS